MCTCFLSKAFYTVIWHSPENVPGFWEAQPPSMAPPWVQASARTGLSVRSRHHAFHFYPLSLHCCGDHPVGSSISPRWLRSGLSATLVSDCLIYPGYISWLIPTLCKNRQRGLRPYWAHVLVGRERVKKKISEKEKQATWYIYVNVYGRASAGLDLVVLCCPSSLLKSSTRNLYLLSG